MAKEWSMNDTQKGFLKALGKGGLTLEQINNGRETEIKSGSINTLTSKGYVTTEKVDYPATETLVVKYPDGVEVTTKKDKTVSRTVYTLTELGKKAIGAE